MSMQKERKSLHAIFYVIDQISHDQLIKEQAS